MNKPDLVSKTAHYVIRCFDISFSMATLIVLSPILIGLIFILRFSGEGEVFYRQVRIGRGGQEFHLLKFATMLKNSSLIGSGELTMPNDKRVLPFGKFLRKSKLNELPQLWNIFIGDLSFIGPRPQTRRYYNLYQESDRVVIAKVRPGLSGVGSILFRDEEQLLSIVDDPVTFDDKIITPYKGVVEHWFVENQSIMLYFELIFITIGVVLFPNHKFHLRIFNRVPDPPSELSKLIKYQN